MVTGIGFGPANLALTIAMEESGFSGDSLFLERKSGSSWQPEMLLRGSDIQNNPLRDLVTPRNPRSRYSFTNFLFENDRLFEHLNLGLEFPLRAEFAQYIQWVSGFFESNVKYNCEVVSVEISKQDNSLYCIKTQNSGTYYARSLVVAPGRTPNVPTQFIGMPRHQVFHLTEFKKNISFISKTQKLSKVVVFGGSQSAVEIILYLHSKYSDLEILNVQRGYNFRLKDTSQFSEHVYFPSFVDYYFNCSEEAKANINKHLHYTNYSAADGDVISELYKVIYEDRLNNEERIKILGSTKVVEPSSTSDSTVELLLEEINTGEFTTVTDIDAVVLATGFKNLGGGENGEKCPKLLNNIYPYLETEEDGAIKLARDYRLTAKAGIDVPPIYLNGLCEASHGYGDAGSLSLIALRSQEIYNSLEAAFVTIATNNSKLKESLGDL